MNPTFDARDQEIVNERTAARDKRTGPRVGDFVLMLDGTTRRFTHHWGDRIQTTIGHYPPGYTDQSFYLDCGSMSFSGSLDSALPIETLQATDETREGSCWIFHHDYATAHNGVSTHIPCRVYRQV